MISKIEKTGAQLKPHFKMPCTTSTYTLHMRNVELKRCAPNANVRTLGTLDSLFCAIRPLAEMKRAILPW